MGNVEIVRILVDAGADLGVENGFGKTALEAAKDRGIPENVQILGDAGAQR